MVATSATRKAGSSSDGDSRGGAATAGAPGEAQPPGEAADIPPPMERGAGDTARKRESCLAAAGALA